MNFDNSSVPFALFHLFFGTKNTDEVCDDFDSLMYSFLNWSIGKYTQSDALKHKWLRFVTLYCTNKNCDGPSMIELYSSGPSITGSPSDC